MRTNRQTRHGFTLVETMVVVAIIGLLASLALPLFAKARRTSLMQKCITNQRAIYGAVMRYEIDHHTDLSDIRNDGVQIRDTLLNGGYISPINNFDCPGSPVKDYDDYLLTYTGHDLVTTSCSILPTEHVLPN
jgi:prepilin-type N-terminal cleavage/methylation domain-containing protein